MRNRVEDFNGPVQKQSPRIGQERLFLDQIQVSLRKPLGERCEDIRKIIDEFSIKDLHILYPHLLASIFSFTSTSKSWALQAPCTRYLEGLRHFLGPHGHVWKLVEKLERDSFLRYEFPVICLTKPSQRLLVEGVVPALYCNKVQLTGENQTPLVIISLGAMEYFLFQFSYYITQSNSLQLDGRSLERSHETLYTALFADYLEHFLPTSIPLTRSERSPGVYPKTRASGYFNSPGQAHVHLSTPFSGLIKSFETKQTPYGPSVEQSSSQMLQGETFLQILIEFWLNHTVDKEGTNTFSPFGQDYFLPGIDHVRVVRMLVKHLHLFMNVNMDCSGPVSSSEVNEHFYRNVMPESLKIFKKRLYWFIHHCFAHWPLDPTFRFILETWLSYIQPWRYIVSEPRQNYDGRGVLRLNWKTFIQHNLLFYTVLLQEFLNRARKFNLRSSRDTQLFYRVTKVFSQDPLMFMVNEVERELISYLTSTQQSFMQRSRSPKSAQYAHFTQLELPGTVYRPLFMEETINNIRYLVRHIEETLWSLKEPQCRDSQAVQDRGWLRRKMRETINWLQNVFSIDEHYWLIQDENHKAQEHLGHVYKQLKRLFQIDDDDHEQTKAWAAEGGDSSPSSIHSLRPRINGVETQPDCVQTEHGMVLTPLGKYQLANGMRRFDIQYSGDPELRPVRSYEVVSVVRALYNLSTTLNKRFGSQLSQLYSSPGWAGSLARYLSPAVPRPRILSPVKHNDSRVPRNHGQPKISLRYLASYRLWAQLLLFVCFMLFVLGRPWSAVLAVLFMLLFMFSRNIYAVHERDDRSSTGNELYSE